MGVIADSAAALAVKNADLAGYVAAGVGFDATAAAAGCRAAVAIGTTDFADGRAGARDCQAAGELADRPVAVSRAAIPGGAWATRAHR